MTTDELRSLQERIDNQHALMKELWISQMIAFSALAQVLPADPSACRQAAARIDADLVPEETPDATVVVAGKKGAAEVLRRVADYLETQKLTALTSGSTH